MKLNKYKFIVVIALWMSVTSGAYAIDLYVNTKTKQIYTEPGPDRERIGTFERVEDRPVKAATPVILPPRNESAELKTRAETARLISKVDSLEKEVKRSNNVKVKLDKKGLQAESADGNFKLKIGGRMHADASVSGNDKFLNGGTPVEANNGTEIRRGRIAFEGTFYKDWQFKSDIDFADNEVGIRDFKLTYAGLKIFKDTEINVTVGHQKHAFSRELQDSSNDLMFIERSLMNVINAPVVDRAMGINVAGYGKKWTAQTGVYGESINTNRDSLDEGWAVASRATFTPILNNDNGVQKLVHLGITGKPVMPVR